jgi:hypothetical protein
MSTAYRRLIDISCAALNPDLNVNAKKVRALIFKRLVKPNGAIRGQLHSVMSRAFGRLRKRGKKLIGRISRDARCSQRIPALIISDRLSKFAARDCVAVLAALQIDYEQALHQLVDFPIPNSANLPRSTSPRASVRIEKARADVLAALRKHTKGQKRIPLDSFWLLKLRDPQWLRKNYPNPLPQTCPSKEQDRNDIEAMLANKSLPIGTRLQLLRKSAAGIRADVRDGTWHARQLKALKQVREAALRADRASTLARRVSAIKKALEGILNADSKPKRISARMLGQRAGLSQSQVVEVIKRTPELRAFKDQVNETKIKRQVVWATKKVLDSGLPLTHKNIGVMAGLPSSRNVIQFMEQAIHDMTKLRRIRPADSVGARERNKRFAPAVGSNRRANRKAA